MEEELLLIVAPVPATPARAIIAAAMTPGLSTATFAPLVSTFFATDSWAASLAVPVASMPPGEGIAGLGTLCLVELSVLVLVETLQDLGENRALAAPSGRGALLVVA